MFEKMALTAEFYSALSHSWPLLLSAPLLAYAAKEAKSATRKRPGLPDQDPNSGSLKVDSERQFRALFDQASVGVALESMEGEILQVNPAFSRLLGYSEQKLKSMRCAQFSHPDDESAEMVLFNELRQGQRTSYRVDKRFRNHKGDWVWARVSVCLLKSGAQNPLVVGFIEDIEDRRQAEEQLKAAKIELEQLAGRLLSAQEQERRRISRELHDDIGQRMSLAINDTEKLQQELTAEKTAVLAVRAGALKEQMLELASAIHDMCSNLHSTKLEHLGLRAALKELCTDVLEHGGIMVSVSVDESANRLQPEVALCLYRVAQEALNNASKHSKATAAHVSLKREGDQVSLTIQDHGAGFDPSIALRSTGIGLASMRERLRTVNGSLVIRTGIGAGTEIIAKVKYLPRTAN